MDESINTRVFESTAKLVESLANEIADFVRFTVNEKDHFDMVLAGGQSPRTFYSFLAENFRRRIPWEKIRFFWSDERYVPHDDPQSNCRMAKETLLDRVPISSKNIFPFPTSFNNPAEAAEAYEILLKKQYSSQWPHFDLTILGLGEDGHVASLFPHTVTLGERARWVVTSLSPIEPVQRLSLTFPAINSSRRIYFFVTGDRKAEAVARALTKKRIEIEDCPARGVKPSDGVLIWWMDKEAAAKSVGKLKAK